MKNKAPKTVSIFVITTIILTILINYLAKHLKSENLSSLFIMWIPGIAALITTLITRRSFREFGWKLSAKWMALGWLIPIAYAAVAYVIIWITGLGGVPNPTFLERASFTLGMNTEPAEILILASFLYITIINLLPAMVMSLGEELGWRGFLVPELSKWTGFKMACWISGVFWAAWHLPGLLSGNYAGHETPFLYQLINFVTMVMSTAVILAWLRMKSKSLWPAVIFHATHNGVIQMFFNRITYDTGLTNYFTGEFGIGIALITFTIAVVIYNSKSATVTESADLTINSQTELSKRQ